MALIDMKGAVPKPNEDTCSIASANERDAYPYGLRLCLRDEVLARLGMRHLPPTGARASLRGVGSIIGVRSEQKQDGSSEQFVELQVEQIEIVFDGVEPADRMYGGMSHD